MLLMEFSDAFLAFLTVLAGVRVRCADAMIAKTLLSWVRTAALEAVVAFA